MSNARIAVKRRTQNESALFPIAALCRDTSLTRPKATKRIATSTTKTTLTNISTT